MPYVIYLAMNILADLARKTGKINRQTFDTETDRHAGTQPARQAGRQTDRQTGGMRYRDGQIR